MKINSRRIIATPTVLLTVGLRALQAREDPSQRSTKVITSLTIEINNRRIIVTQTVLPTVGPGALQAREDPSQRSTKVITSVIAEIIIVNKKGRTDNYLFQRAFIFYLIEFIYVTGIQLGLNK